MSTKPDIDRAGLMHAIWDGVTDRLDPDLEATDEFYDWYEEVVETPVAKILCHIYGHEPIRDACSKPEHDYCAWCSKSMPGAAGDARLAAEAAEGFSPEQIGEPRPGPGASYEWVVYEGLNKDLTKAHLSREPYKMTACGRQIMTGSVYGPTQEWDRCGQCMKIRR